MRIVRKDLFIKCVGCKLKKILLKALVTYNPIEKEDLQVDGPPEAIGTAGAGSAPSDGAANDPAKMILRKVKIPARPDDEEYKSRFRWLLRHQDNPDPDQREDDMGREPSIQKSPLEMISKRIVKAAGVFKMFDSIKYVDLYAERPGEEPKAHEGTFMRDIGNGKVVILTKGQFKQILESQIVSREPVEEVI